MPYADNEKRKAWRRARRLKDRAVTPTTETTPTPAVVAPYRCSRCHGRDDEIRRVVGRDLRALRHRLGFPTRWAFAAWLALPDAAIAALEANPDGPVPEHVAARVAPWMP